MEHWWRLKININGLRSSLSRRFMPKNRLDDVSTHINLASQSWLQMMLILLEKGLWRILFVQSVVHIRNIEVEFGIWTISMRLYDWLLTLQHMDDFLFHLFLKRNEFVFHLICLCIYIRGTVSSMKMSPIISFFL